MQSVEQTIVSFMTFKNKDHGFQIGKEEEKLSLLTELIYEFNNKWVQLEGINKVDI